MESQTQGGKEGVIEIVMKAMSMHISNEEVCSNGCFILCNTVFNDCKGNTEFIFISLYNPQTVI